MQIDFAGFPQRDRRCHNLASPIHACARTKQGNSQLIKSNWIRGGRIAAAFFMAAVLFVEAGEIGKVNTLPPLIHKVEHFLYFGLMALLFAHGFGRRWFWMALLVVPLIGALDEWHQLYVPLRNGSVWDWMTDAAGTIVAVYMYSRWIVRREPKGAPQGDTDLRP